MTHSAAPPPRAVPHNRDLRSTGLSANDVWLSSQGRRQAGRQGLLAAGAGPQTETAQVVGRGRAEWATVTGLWSLRALAPVGLWAEGGGSVC